MTTNSAKIVAPKSAPLSEPKWTPGPWRVVQNTRLDYCNVAAADGSGTVVAQCNTQGPATPKEESNARLIADAPAMHARLEANFIALGRAGGNMADSPYREEWEATRALLARLGAP